MCVLKKTQFFLLCVFQVDILLYLDVCPQECHRRFFFVDLFSGCGISESLRFATTKLKRVSLWNIWKRSMRVFFSQAKFGRSMKFILNCCYNGLERNMVFFLKKTFFFLKFVVR